ncbi:MAG: beta-ketoacyl-ACP synthase I [Proteobacteria bacterium]|nr:beta-ketoacyl-ACP synthase I [Pseudomonadota bacterium]
MPKLTLDYDFHFPQLKPQFSPELRKNLRRVVVTGLGIVSCIGVGQAAVLDSLMEGKSGLSFAQEYADLNFRSHVHGKPVIDLDALVDRRVRRFMGDGAAYNYVAMQEAIADAGLETKDVSNERTGIVMGSGGPSTVNLLAAHDATREGKGPKKMGPLMVPRTMSSTNSATLATPFEIKGVNYSISSACATSAHCIGNGVELIQMGKQDIVFAGGGEEVHWSMTCMFDAMGALSSKYNATPEKASRAYDANRDGFVIAGGAGVLVLESLDHALARGAKIYGEVTGYGATSDGYDMVAPSGEGAKRCMEQALATVPTGISYINTHGTSTPVGDTKELEAIKATFSELKQDVPAFSSTKSLTGHSLGATGVQEAIYSLLMMKNNFITASANIEALDPAAEGMPVVQKRLDNVKHSTVLSNSFGFGGTNATLALSVFEG